MPHTPTLSGASRMRSTAAVLHAGTLSYESLQHESDERLVALTRAGSERAFAEITRRYQRQLRAYCARLVGAERAQDAVQQALLQAFLSLRDRAPREIALRPWLYRIAHNCAIDLLRMGAWDYEELDQEFDGVPQPPAVFEQREELRGLVAGMRRLPEAQRRALALRELEGCSYEEISARLGHSGSGVRQLIFRARQALRKGASAAFIPFALVRERLAPLAPAIDGHHVAGVAAGPAQSGHGLETLGAAALAVVAVLGGVAGGTRGGQPDQRRHSHVAPAHSTGTPVSTAPAPLAQADIGRQRRPRPTAPPRRSDLAAPAPVQAQTAVPVVASPPASDPAPAPPAPPAPDAGSEAAPSAAPPGAADVPQAVDQQSVPATSPGPGRGSETQPDPPAPGASQPQTGPTGPPGQVPAQAAVPQSAVRPKPAPKPRPATKPRPTAKPVAGAPQVVR